MTPFNLIRAKLKMTLNFEFNQEQDQITDLLHSIKQTGTPPRKLKKYPIVI